GNPTGTSTLNYLLRDQSPELILRDYIRNNTDDNAHGGYNLNLNHKYDFDDNGSNIITNLSYSGHSMNSNEQFVQTDHLNALNNLDITQTADNSNKEIEAKTDFTKKFGENTRLELGWNSTWQNRVSLAGGYDNANKIDILSYYNKFDYKEQVHAAYATYGTRFDNFSLQAGLRGEYLRKQITSTSKNISTSATEINRLNPQSYFELFPSLYMSYTLPKNNELQLNYTRRVNRPRGRQINSFRDYSDATTISYGNPALLPEFASAFELNYVKNWDNHTFSASMYYRFTDDVIQNVNFMRNNVMESTFMNLTKQQNTGLELVAKNRLFKIVNLTSSVNLYYAKLHEATYQDPFNSAVNVKIPGNENFSWDTRVIANLMLSRTFSAQVTGMYSAPQVMAQGERAEDFSVDLGLRKTFLDKKFSLNVMVRDLLNSRKMSSTRWGDGFYQVSENRFSGRMIGFTVTYNFGNMKPKPSEKKSGNTGESNDEGMDME
ncbi:MAG: TonB-dependent receptor, partial [Bacteroidetes bacterium]|nr:TonB-dependent receptor [Bacteroidota bacterium]